MKLSDFGLLTDQNIHPQVVGSLRQIGFDVRDVKEERWFDLPDSEILELALRENRVVVTHDADFGTLSMIAGQRAIGIIYARPGHANPAITIDSLSALLALNPDVTPAFIVVLRHRSGAVVIRVRRLP